MKKVFRVMSLEDGDKEFVFDGSPETAKAEKEAKALFDKVMAGGGAVFNVVPGGTEPGKKVGSFKELGEESIAVGRVVGG